MEKENKGMPRIMSLQKRELIRYLGGYPQDRINILENQGHEGGVFLLAGKAEFAELEKARENESTAGQPREGEKNET